MSGREVEIFTSHWWSIHDSVSCIDFEVVGHHWTNVFQQLIKLTSCALARKYWLVLLPINGRFEIGCFGSFTKCIFDLLMIRG